MELELLTNPTGPPEGRPVLFVHGAWQGAWCWEDSFLPFFAEHGYQAYAVSVRGHGASEGHEGLRWWSIANYVADITHFADSLTQLPIMVGHSMGGFIVQHYLAERDAPAAVLLAPVPVTGTLRAALRFARRRPVPFLKGNATLSLWPFVGTSGLAREVLFRPDIPDDQLDAHFARLQDESFRAFLDMTFRRPRPSRVDTPILVLGGDADELFEVEEFRQTAEAYGGVVEIYPDMAHQVMHDQDWEKAAQRAVNWLRSMDL